MEYQSYTSTSTSPYIPQKAKKPYFYAIIVCAIVCIIAFFCPLCTLSVLGLEIDFSGWTLSIGLELLGDHIDGSPIIFIFLIFPVAMLVVPFMNRSAIHRVAQITGIAQVLSLILGAILLSSNAASEYENLAELSFTFWYFLDLLSAAAATLFGFFGLRNFSIVSWTTQKALDTKEAYSSTTQSSQPNWECPSCHTKNIASTQFCPNCGTKKVVAPTSPPTEKWKCPVCNATNDKAVNFCPNCGRKKPAPVSSTAPSKWVCLTCKTQYDSSLHFCPTCGREKPALTAASRPSPWECPSCHNTNNPSIRFCTSCGSKNPASVITPTPSKWECPSCLKTRDHSVQFCPNCGRKRSDN